MSFVAAITAAGGIYGAVSANQDRQKAKGTQGAAIDAANNAAAQRAPYNTLALNSLTAPRTAAQLQASYGNGPQYSAVSSPLLTQGNDATAKTLASLTDSPDYLSQAKSALQDWETGQQPVLAADFRKVGQNAAALGRVGSGGVTTQLGTLQSDYERNKQLTANQLIQAALDQTQQNKYATLGAAQGVANQAYNQGNTDRTNMQNVAQEGVTNAINEQGQGNALALGEAGIGTGYNPSGALQTAANAQMGDANTSANDVASLFGTAGQFLGRRGAAPTIQPTGVLSGGMTDATSGSV
jgi:hypothetical protein